MENYRRQVTLGWTYKELVVSSTVCASEQCYPITHNDLFTTIQWVKVYVSVLLQEFVYISGIYIHAYVCTCMHVCMCVSVCGCMYVRGDVCVCMWCGCMYVCVCGVDVCMCG